MPTETTPQQIIPIFKEKAIFFGSSDGGTSYAVSASFRGIIRLSPNDASTLKTAQSTLNYADAIGEYLRSENELIQVSDSDGNMLDMRYNKEKVSISTIYVVGMASPKKIYLYTKNRKAFKIGNNEYPIVANDFSTGDDETTHDSSDLPYGPSWLAENTKAIAKHTSTLVYETETSSGSSKWKYINTRQFVEEAVIEALLSLKTIPSGSIHYFPLTYTQYYSLLQKNHSTDPNNPKGTNIISTDPIIRDYLLCDGRRYLTRDFPELAKILNGEDIFYERPYRTKVSKSYPEGMTAISYVTSVNSEGYISQNAGNVGDTMRLRRFKHTNGKDDTDTQIVTYGEGATSEKTVHTFRVPDLRHLFPKSALFSTSAGDSQNINPLNKAGSYFIDFVPTGEKIVKDDHFHFSFFGSHSLNYWDPYPCTGSGNSISTSSQQTSYRHATKARTAYHGESMRNGGGAFAILANNSWYLDYTGYYANQRDSLVTSIFGHNWWKVGPWGSCFFGQFNKSNYLITSPGKRYNTKPDCGNTGISMTEVYGSSRYNTIGSAQEGAYTEYILRNNTSFDFSKPLYGMMNTGIRNPINYAQETTPRYIGFLPLIKI